MSVKTQDIVNSFLEEEKYRENFVYHTIYKCFCLYDNGYYRILKQEELKEVFTRYVLGAFKEKSFTKQMLRDNFELLSILAEKIEVESFKYVTFKDCLLDTETFTTHKFDRKKISLHKLPFFFEDTKKAPAKFIEFLQQCIVHEDNPYLPDEELIKLVQEMMGYFLVGNMHGATAWFLVGRGANGKSVLADTIGAMIGKHFVSNSTIQMLTTDKFHSQKLIGKRLNISNEEESKYVDTSKFKALITGNEISAEYKFGDHIDFKPSTKYIFCTNNIPTFKEIDQALKRRIQIIPFFRVFAPEERNINLEWPNSIFQRELAGIIGWALEGAKRLVNNNYVYSGSASSNKAMVKFESEISSALRFVREGYEVDINAFLLYEEIYYDYRGWCTDNGKKAMSKDRFCNDIDLSINGIERIRKRVDGVRQWGFNLIKKDKYADDVIKSFEESV